MYARRLSVAPAAVMVPIFVMVAAAAAAVVVVVVEQWVMWLWQGDASLTFDSEISFHFEVRTRSEPGSTLRSGPLRLGPRTWKYGSGPLSHRTEPRTCGFGSVRTSVRIGPDRTVDSVVLTHWVTCVTIVIKAEFGVDHALSRIETEKQMFFKYLQ